MLATSVLPSSLGVGVAVRCEFAVLQVVPELTEGVPPAASEPVGLGRRPLVRRGESEAAVEDVVCRVLLRVEVDAGEFLLPTELVHVTAKTLRL